MFAFSLKAFVTFVTVIDPVGLVPLVLGLTGSNSASERRAIILRATFIAALVIAFFGAFGRWLFENLGISLMAFDIAGGALLFLVSIDMVFGRPSGARETEREERDARTRDDVSVFPLAIPLIAGPGTLASVILLMTSAGGDAMRIGVVATAGAVTLLLALGAMLMSSAIERRVGTTGILVLSRILGMLLAALAVQFILNGIAQYVGTF
ncbi:MAG: NAAT family transporter [Ktedonobacterales bacterium]|nr:NAAT family transporter [Ktedonobacterales bacterium]